MNRSAQTSLTGTDFKVSSFCTGGGCVEVGGSTGGNVVVRDAKDLRRSVALTFSPGEWATFLTGIRAGEFDPRR